MTDSIEESGRSSSHSSPETREVNIRQQLKDTVQKGLVLLNAKVPEDASDYWQQSRQKFAEASASIRELIELEAQELSLNDEETSRYLDKLGERFKYWGILTTLTYRAQQQNPDRPQLTADEMREDPNYLQQASDFFTQDDSATRLQRKYLSKAKEPTTEELIGHANTIYQIQYLPEIPPGEKRN